MTQESQSGDATKDATKSYSYDAYGHRISLRDDPVDPAKPTKDYTYSYDVHGSVSGLVDEAGSVAASYGYEAYGEKDAGLSAGDPEDANPLNPYRYSARRFDSGSGTIDMGARRFGPDVARFLQPDLFLGALADLGLSTDPLTGNRYALAAGNPLSFVEWDGHMPINDGYGGSGPNPNPTSGKPLPTFTQAREGTGPPTSPISLRDFLATHKPADSLRSILTEPIKVDPCGLLNALTEGGLEDPYTVSTVCVVNEQVQVVVPVCVPDMACFGVVQNTYFARPLNPPGGSSSGIGKNRRTGLRLEEEIRNLIGGVSKFFRLPSLRGRFVDVWSEASRTAYEIKSGYTAKTTRILEQISRDVELLKSRAVNEVVWVFRRSPVTGQIGASDPLIRALEEARITVAYYP